MKARIILSGLVCILTLQSQAQVAGNVTFDQNGNSYLGNQRIQTLNRIQSRQSLYTVHNKEVEFNLRIQYHAKIFEYAVTFGVSEEAVTVDSCSRGIMSRIDQFIIALEDIGIGRELIFVDDITHNRVYEYSVDRDTGYHTILATEKMVGYVIKKNIIIRYRDHELLTEINRLAAQQGIYDLIKVDYAIEPIEDVLIKLLPEMNKLVNKRQEFIRETGEKDQFRNHRFSNIQVTPLHPTVNYHSYVAQNTNRVDMTGYYYRNVTRISARKESTLFYHPEDAASFDIVMYGNENTSVPTIIYEIYIKITCEAR